MHARRLVATIHAAILLTAIQSCNSDDDARVENDTAIPDPDPESGVVQEPNPEPVLPEGFVGAPAATIPLTAEEAQALEAASELIRARASEGDAESRGIASPPLTGAR